MILLDTNVVSELLRDSPSEAVLAWYASVPDSDLATSSVVVAELLTGVAVLPDGARKRHLEQQVDEFLAAFEGRVWPFDEAAASTYATVVAERRRAGLPIAVMDALTAATARSRNAAVATRDVDGMQCHGLSVIDPWAH